MLGRVLRSQTKALAGQARSAKSGSTNGSAHFYRAPKASQLRQYATSTPKSTEDLFDQIYDAPEPPKTKSTSKGSAGQTTTPSTTVGSHVLSVSRKAPSKRRDGEVVAHRRSIRTSMKKILPLTHLVIKRPLLWAIDQMALSQKAVARIVKSHLVCAKNNAVHNHGLDPAKLIVSSIVLGRGTPLKRILPHSKGRAGIVHIPHIHMSIYVREKLPKDFKKRPILSAKWGKSRAALAHRHQQFSRRLAEDIKAGKVQLTKMSSTTS